MGRGIRERESCVRENRRVDSVDSVDSVDGVDGVRERWAEIILHFSLFIFHFSFGDAEVLPVNLSQCILLMLVCLCLPACRPGPPPRADEREAMVERLIKVSKIRDERVLAVMRAVPRHEFVPAELTDHAYDEQPLPIGYQQTISQPYMVAFMTERLAPKPTDRVLEIGTGSGYQAAVLAKLVAEVFTIEIVEPLAKRAGADLARLGFKNVHVRAGDGYQGWPEAAPFDSIIVTCAPDHVPEPLVRQLKDGGTMIVPVGKLGGQELYVLEKHGDKIEQRTVLPVNFVPMTGKADDKVTR
jgi:protein-L-isoaspartate(D-aspartate) O-methyltransferase